MLARKLGPPGPVLGHLHGHRRPEREKVARLDARGVPLVLGDVHHALVQPGRAQDPAERLHVDHDRLDDRAHRERRRDCADALNGEVERLFVRREDADAPAATPRSPRSADPR